MAYKSSRYVCNAYVKMCLKKIPYESEKTNALNIHICANELLSFSTPIVKFNKGKFYITKVWYSATTKKHQTYAREALNRNRIPKKNIVEIDVPIFRYKFDYS